MVSEEEGNWAFVEETDLCPFVVVGCSVAEIVCARESNGWFRERDLSMIEVQHHSLDSFVIEIGIHRMLSRS